MKVDVPGTSTAVRWLPALVAAWFSLGGGVRADLVYFRNGGEIQAPVAMRGDSIVIDLAGEEYVFPPEDVRKRLPGFLPSEEWSERAARAREAGADSRFANAWWALENGLTDEAVAEVKAIHQAAPMHGPAGRMAAMIARLEPPCNDPEMPGFRGALRVAFETARGPHVLLLHQHSDAEAAARVALLERVVTSYYLTFAGSGIELQVPKRRVVFAWFADRTDYLAFLKSQGAGAFETTRGYYHPTWNAVVSYDAHSAESDRRERDVFAARRGELKRFQTVLDRLPPRARARVVLADEPAQTVGKADGAALIDRLERDVRRRELLLADRRLAMDDGIAAHETIHLLAAASGLQPRHDAFPIWLQEGLAMQFEVVRGGRWAGIGRAHDIRLADWRSLNPPPPLEPLVRDKGFGRGYQRDPYVQAWALVYFLRARRSAQFVTFLDLLRNPSPATDDHPESPPTPFDAFRRAFGTDLESLEREWHEFLRNAATPLELHAPKVLPAASQPGSAPHNRLLGHDAIDRSPGIAMIHFTQYGA
ncbi:DUF1570 domain-containing protein [Paludisphaera borealis]|uniref:DUF1570 domain-containing protein n=1 Tax=Paludisphaera borealis TaxID=1387353 RepID=UPI00097107CE|nr:DUF1570 domain-containing protein [Paludisphaera borealis]